LVLINRFKPVKYRVTGLIPRFNVANLKKNNMKKAEKIAEKICRYNAYLLNEPEVKEIISEWQKCIDLASNEKKLRERLHKIEK
jgi:hypothetical protein